MTGTAEGTVARISDRIMDCPASVIVRPGDCGHAPIPTANTIAEQLAAKIIRLRMNLASPSSNEVTIRQQPFTASGVSPRPPVRESGGILPRRQFVLCGLNYRTIRDLEADNEETAL